eukprot:1179779-Prorocentrum_minimum.AAC.1
MTSITSHYIDTSHRRRHVTSTRHIDIDTSHRHITSGFRVLGETILALSLTYLSPSRAGDRKRPTEADRKRPTEADRKRPTEADRKAEEDHHGMGGLRTLRWGTLVPKALLSRRRRARCWNL